MDLRNAHPNYWIMNLPESELTNELMGWSRDSVISWLAWNDPNGVYKDEDSMREFDCLLSKDEGVEIIIRQIIQS